MQYFDTLPKVIYTNNGVSQIYTNLMARASVVPEFLKNPSLYYKYSIQEGDTPEIIAAKYYNDSYRYWIVLFTNQLLDPQWDWPLTGQAFEIYIQKKYSNVNPHNVVHHYEKTIKQYNTISMVTTENTIVIDDVDYERQDKMNYVAFIGVEEVQFEVTKKAVSLYEHEYILNEAKRDINLLNTSYVNELEKQLKKLMAA
jgi:hypothetical protein